LAWWPHFLFSRSAGVPLSAFLVRPPGRRSRGVCLRRERLRSARCCSPRIRLCSQGAQAARSLSRSKNSEHASGPVVVAVVEDVVCSEPCREARFRRRHPESYAAREARKVERRRERRRAAAFGRARGEETAEAGEAHCAVNAKPAKSSGRGDGAEVGGQERRPAWAGLLHEAASWFSANSEGPSAQVSLSCLP
jgi:hypothetical protein